MSISSSLSVAKVHVFYHICCNENTLSIVKDQVTKLLYSGLYDSVTAIHCFLVGNTDVILQVIEVLESSGKKFHIADVSSDDTSYERFTLLRIGEMINQNDYILYIHTKGITRSGEEGKCCEDWRHFLEYHLIYKFQGCIGKLIQGYQTVGVNLQLDPAPHYSGNFWWCRGEYWLSLDPKNLERKFYGSTYLACEMFLLSGLSSEDTKTAYQMARSEVTNHYKERYPWALYIDQAP